MADLESSEYGFRFATGVKTDQQPNPMKGARFDVPTVTLTTNADTIKLFRLPAFYELHTLVLRVTANFLTVSGNFDVGVYAFNSVTGAIGTVVDVDSYIDNADALLDDTFVYPSGALITGLDAQSTETVVVMTFKGAGTVAAGACEGTWTAMATALP